VHIGQAELSLTWRRLPAQDGAELVIEQRGGASLEVDAWLACPTGAQSARIVVDGRRARARRRHDPGCDRLGVRVTVPSGGAVRVVTIWSPLAPDAPPARPRNVRHMAPRDATFGRSVRHMRLRDGTPQVVYVGFLAPPFRGLDLRHVPLNYASRRPQALLDLLPTARAVVLTDQQDAPLSEPLAEALASYVTERGGALLFFCYWSAAWGRGFFDTYCSIARSSIPDLLPLTFRRAPIQTTSRLRVAGPGQHLWADLPWQDAPAIDYQPADLRPGALAWATAEASADALAGKRPTGDASRDVLAAKKPTADSAGDVLAASWTLGAGRVVAIGLDAFGFGHGTLVHWPGQRLLLGRALEWLLGGAR
jgi:hypothetical protein